MVVSSYSNRIYKNDLKNEEDNELSYMLKSFSDTKIKCYAHKIHNKIANFNTTYIRNTYGYNTYYSNMIIREVNQCISSNNELQTLYITDLEDKIELKKEKILTLKNKLLYWKNLKVYCIELASNKTKTLKYIFPFNFYMKDDNIYAKNNKKDVFNIYDFELQVVNNQIKRRKYQIFMLKLSIERLQNKLKRLQIKAYRNCFGSKSFFKNQYTIDEYKNNHNKWKEEFYHRRHNQITISGCASWKQGNGCVRYKDNKLSIMKMNDIEVPDKKYSKSEWFEVPITFKYNEDLYYKALTDGKSSISYQIRDYKDYYIIIATFEIEKDNRNNYYLSDGIIGIDLNYDHFALCNIDKHGNYIDSKVIPFNIKNKTSNQITKTLEKAVLEVVKYCEDNHKPLVREEIQKIKLKNLGCKKQNEKISQFAYDKMITTIDRCCFKNNIEVYKIAPSYTSQLGKIKYMKQLGLSIHQSASYCIARRLLLTKPKKKKIKIYPVSKNKTIKEAMKLKFKKDKEFKKLNIKNKKEIRKTKPVARNNYYIEKLNKYKSFGDYKKICNELKPIWKDWLYKIDKVEIKLEECKNLKEYVTKIKNYFTGKKEVKIIPPTEAIPF